MVPLDPGEDRERTTGRTPTHAAVTIVYAKRRSLDGVADMPAQALTVKLHPLAEC